MTDALAQIAAAFQAEAATTGDGEVGAEASVLVRLAASLDANTRELRAARAARNWENIHPAPIFPLAAATAAGAVSMTDADRWGPRQGWAWDIRFFVADGLLGGSPQQVEGQVTAPAANANICSISTGASVPGVYMAYWSVDYDGTPGAGEVNNMKLTVGATTIAVAVCNGAVGHYTQNPVQITIPAGGAQVAVKAIGVGTAGAIYSAQVTLVPVGVNADEVTLYKGPAVPPNRLHVFSAPGTSPGPDWSPAKAAWLLLPGDILTLAGSGLTSAAVTAWGQVVEIALDCLHDYLR